MENKMLAFCPKCGERYERMGIGEMNKGAHECPQNSEVVVDNGGGDGTNLSN